MAFVPLQYDSGMTKMMKIKDGESVSKFDALQFDSGEVKRAESDTRTVRFISLQDVSSADDEYILALDVRGVEFEADCDNDTDQDQVGLGQSLQDHKEVDNDNTETDNEDAFVITQIVGKDSEQKVRGYFLDRTAGSN